VLEPLSGYLLLASKMYKEPRKFSGAWNFGPNHDSIVPVRKIVSMIVEKWGVGKWLDISDKSEPHEANLLSLDISKARNFLNWHPKWNIQKCIEKTMEWYKNYNNEDVYELCLNQIKTILKSKESQYE